MRIEAAADASDKQSSGTKRITIELQPTTAGRDVKDPLGLPLMTSFVRNLFDEILAKLARAISP